MRVIFVGIHNKPGMNPLDSKTKTGKLIDRIIERLSENTEALKTNLCDCVHFVTDLPELYKQCVGWHVRIRPEDSDVIVLLGAWVHKNFWYDGLNVVKLAHPASKRSHLEMNCYVNDALVKIALAVKIRNCPTYDFKEGDPKGNCWGNGHYDCKNCEHYREDFKAHGQNYIDQVHQNQGNLQFKSISKK